MTRYNGLARAVAEGWLAEPESQHGPLTRHQWEMSRTARQSREGR